MSITQLDPSKLFVHTFVHCLISWTRSTCAFSEGRPPSVTSAWCASSMPMTLPPSFTWFAPPNMASISSSMTPLVSGMKK